MCIEGVYTRGLFRSLKSYALLGESQVVRCKGVARVAREALPEHVFLPRTSEDPEPRVAYYQLKTTHGLEMSMNVHCRRLPLATNFKRCSLVSS
jgi:hypothetical protein